VRISLLAAREPWLHIAADSLARHWTRSLAREHRVSITGEGEQTWYCSPYLNAIFVRDVDRAVFDPIRREFSHSLVAWKRPVQKAYVGAATGIAATLFTTSRLGVSPAIEAAHTKLIVAGNNKMRILDRAAGTCTSIVKCGFDSSWLRREVEARAIAAAAGVPVPEICSSDDEALTERYVSATPVNRIADASARERLLADATAALARFHDATRETEHVQSFVQRLRAAIAKNAKRVPESGAGDAARAARIADAIARALSSWDEDIETVLSHGDFQQANILTDDGVIWIIDWENAARRQRLYDDLVLTMASRFPTGLAQRLNTWISSADARVITSVTHGEGPAPGPIAKSNPLGERPAPGPANSNVPTTRNARLRYALLFLLEELENVTRENANPQFHRVGASLPLMVAECERFERELA